MLSEVMKKVKAKEFNKTLKILFDSFEQKLWDYRKKDRSVGKWIKPPTVATIEKWYDFWKDKVKFTESEIEYFEMVKDFKKEIS